MDYMRRIPGLVRVSSGVARLLATSAVLMALIWVSGARAAETVTYHYTDQQGTVLADTDSNGNVGATYDYGVFGQEVVGTPSGGPAYTGHVTDTDSGLVYMQARYMDPASGRFMSLDPLATNWGNGYEYANNNPYSFVDPDGQLADGNAEGEPKKPKCNVDCRREKERRQRDKNNEVYTGNHTLSGRITGWKGDGSGLTREWDLDSESKDGGYVIQHVTLDGVVYYDDGTNEPIKLEWWESFYVMPGTKAAVQADDFSAPSNGSKSGNVTVQGEARFYDGLTQLPGWTLLPYAGASLATTTDPHLDTSKASNTVTITWRYSWPPAH